MAVDNGAYEVDDASEEKRTSETNTVSNELNGKRVMQSGKTLHIYQML